MTRGIFDYLFEDLDRYFFDTRTFRPSTKVVYYTNSPVIVPDSAYKEIQAKAEAVKQAEKALAEAKQALIDAKQNAVQNFLAAQEDNKAISSGESAEAE